MEPDPDVPMHEAPRPGAATAPPPPQAALIHPGPRGMLFWARVRDTWLANRALDRAEAHVKCGLGWNAKAYLPLLIVDQRGIPLLAFHRP